MELLSALVFCSVLLFSNARSPASVVSADCNDTEKDAGLALDLINKHRKEGYVFFLLRVADAHVQHVGNASIFYFTLDVLETECPVISRKHWETCDFRPSFGILDFGRCNAVLYINPSLQRERLYGYSCTISPVPPKLYECRDCPVKITVLENVQQYTTDAERILERYIQDSNQTEYFKVKRVTKAFLAVGSKAVYYIEFTIEETTCPNSSLVSGCKLFPEREAHIGFCRGKVLNGTEDAEGAEVESCEIYDIQQLGRHPPHGHPRNNSEESHHPCKGSRHRCRDPWHRHHHHSECRPPPHHHHPHHHHHLHHHHHHHHHPHHHHHHHHHHPHHHHHDHFSPSPPPPAHPSSLPPPPHHHHHHFHHHHHHHGRFRPHDHHRHRHCHSIRPCGSADPVGPSNSSKESQEIDYPALPPPPGPQYPPPPPGGPHHFPPSQFPVPPNGPPPPLRRPFRPLPPDHDDDDDHHHPPEGPSFQPQSRLPCGSRHRHHHVHPRNNIGHERQEDTSSEDHDSFQSPYSFLKDEDASVHFIPLASEQDHLQAPGADFSFPSDDKDDKAVTQPFPLTRSESESCPGKPTFDALIDLLSFYPTIPTH